jgi:hypothetical protein
MPFLSRWSRPCACIFVATFLLATAFAAYTQHAWEDYSDGHEQVLASRPIDPVSRPSDRGVQVFEIDLPRSEKDAELTFAAASGVGSAKDWTCWAKPEFR